MDEKLIEEVRERSFLYDKSHKDYKKNDKRDQAWEDIGKELNITGDKAKKRWRTIKDRYMRLRQKSSNYKFSEMLSFLDNCSSVNKKTHCSYGEAAALSFEQIMKEEYLQYTGNILESTIQGEEETHQSESNEVDGGATYPEYRTLSSSSSGHGRKQRDTHDDVLIKQTSTELLNLMRSLKEDFKTTSKEAAFCDSLRVQLEGAQLPPDSFMQFQIKVLQVLSEEVAKTKRDMPSTSKQF